MQKRATALLATAIMALASFSCLAGIVKGEGEPGDKEVSTVPISDGGNVAVVFADNMVFTPQFREGNKIRLEFMPLFVGDLTDPASLVVGPPLLVDGLPIKSPTVDQLADTTYVSLPSLTVVVTGSGYSRVWTSDWTDNDPMQITKEVNSVGNLIYGIQWDTGEDIDFENPGIYTVTVELPSGFPLKMVLMTDTVNGGVTTLDGTRGGTNSEGNAYITLNIVAKGGGHGGSDGGTGSKWHGGKK